MHMPCFSVIIEGTTFLDLRQKTGLHDLRRWQNTVGKWLKGCCQAILLTSR